MGSGACETGAAGSPPPILGILAFALSLRCMPTPGGVPSCELGSHSFGFDQSERRRPGPEPCPRRMCSTNSSPNRLVNGP